MDTSVEEVSYVISEAARVNQKSENASMPPERPAARRLHGARRDRRKVKPVKTMDAR